MHPTPDTALPAPTPETLKETLISIVIAFALAFVFRGFVIEAFVIPTGSMAPTLMGAHMRFQGRDTGYNWPVGPDPNQSASGDRTVPKDPQQNIAVTDPISGELREHKQVGVRSGDRILVLKYLYTIAEPERFDVVVFKNPQFPQENYIKRLLGLAGEQIALVDGDVFTRTPKAGDPPHGTGDPWELPGWTIARKGPIQQRAVWQQVYDSSFAPLEAGSQNVPWMPGDPKAWDMKARTYIHPGAERAELIFDQNKQRSDIAQPPGRRLTWAIDDYYPYNETNVDPRQTSLPPRYPVGDIRVRAGILAKAPNLTAAVKFTVKNHDFEIALGNGKAKIAWREPQGAAGTMSSWKDLASAPFAGFPVGEATNVEVWHADQAVGVWVNGREIVRAEYTWSPAERVLFATGKPLPELMAEQPRDMRNVLADQTLYRAGAIKDLRWVFEGAPFELFRVGVDRDLFYQPGNLPMGGMPSTATNPNSLLTLSNDQFFVCGDNSPASLDGRLWEKVDPWVSREFPPPEGDQYRETGVVPRDLLLGRAFFVYWPSLRYDGKPTPVPDFGRMRLIW